jgi:hypothetical protein
MNPQLIPKERKYKQKYTKKDGTVVEKEYVQRYLVQDRTEEKEKKALVDKLKNATPEQIAQIKEILK